MLGLAMVAGLIAFFLYFVRPHRFGQERRGDGSDAHVTPFLLGVSYEFSDEERCQDACGFHPMTGRSE